MSIPPAQPIVNSSSSSESRLSNIFPVNISLFRPLAPVIPLSSSTVNNASIGGWGISVDSKIVIAAATPMPLSAPNVVPFAFTQSPSIIILIPSFSKS